VIPLHVFGFPYPSPIPHSAVLSHRLLMVHTVPLLNSEDLRFPRPSNGPRSPSKPQLGSGEIRRKQLMSPLVRPRGPALPCLCPANASNGTSGSKTWQASRVEESRVCCWKNDPQKLRSATFKWLSSSSAHLLEIYHGLHDFLGTESGIRTIESGFIH
jgi:hypothetical protein